MIFIASLKSQLPIYVPNANVAAIINAGASGFHATVEPGDFQYVLGAYSDSIDRVSTWYQRWLQCAGWFFGGLVAEMLGKRIITYRSS